MMRGDLRNANIGIGVGVVFLATGLFFLGSSGEDALELLGLGTLVVALGTFMLLEEREERRHKRNQ